MTWDAKQNPIDGNWLVMDDDEPVLNFYRGKETAESVVMVIRGAIEEVKTENARLRGLLETEKESRRKVEAHLLWGRNILSGILYEPQGGAAQAECLAAARLWLPATREQMAEREAPPVQQKGAPS